jgi:hypothetical protein
LNAEISKLKAANKSVKTAVQKEILECIHDEFIFPRPRWREETIKMRCERGAVPLFPSIFGRVFTKSNKAPCRHILPFHSFWCAPRKKPIAGT